MDWDNLETLLAEVDATAVAQSHIFDAEAELQRWARVPLRVSSTIQSRRLRDVGNRRRRGQSLAKIMARFSDMGLVQPSMPERGKSSSSLYPCEVPRPPKKLLQRPRSAPAPAPRKEVLTSLEDRAVGQHCWQQFEPERERGKKSTLVIRGTTASVTREALAAGVSTLEIKRVSGELAGVGFGIGDRFESPQSKPGPGDYDDDHHGTVALWKEEHKKSCPSQQPCSKYRSASPARIGANRKGAQITLSRRKAANASSFDWTAMSVSSPKSPPRANRSLSGSPQANQRNLFHMG